MARPLLEAGQPSALPRPAQNGHPAAAQVIGDAPPQQAGFPAPAEQGRTRPAIGRVPVQAFGNEGLEVEDCGIAAGEPADVQQLRLGQREQPGDQGRADHLGRHEGRHAEQRLAVGDEIQPTQLERQQAYTGQHEQGQGDIGWCAGRQHLDPAHHRQPAQPGHQRLQRIPQPFPEPQQEGGEQDEGRGQGTFQPVFHGGKFSKGWGSIRTKGLADCRSIVTGCDWRHGGHLD